MWRSPGGKSAARRATEVARDEPSGARVKLKKGTLLDVSCRDESTGCDGDKVDTGAAEERMEVDEVMVLL